jgi:hypothetical protein
MPETAPYTAYGTEIMIDKKNVHLVRIFVDPDGNGVVELPDGMTILKVPGSALTILSTYKAHGLGFRMRVSGPSSVVGFLSLVV